MCNKENNKTCSNTVECSKKCNNSIDYLIVIVLYILLIIILGACLF